MGRFKTIAGYFKDVVEKQKITISQNVHMRDESGNFMFEEDKATPVMQPMAVEIDADVKNIVWVPQENIPFTPEEEAARDVEEALHESEKNKPIPMTTEEELNLLLEEGAEAVKAKRAEHEKAMALFLEEHNRLKEMANEKYNQIMLSIKANENAVN